MKKRIVVTGMGIVSSIGIGKDSFWQNLIQGKSGITELSEFHTLKYNPLKAGVVKNFKLIKKEHRVGRASLFAVEAAREAIKDANISNIYPKENRIGIICGTTNGESHFLEEIDRIWFEKGEEEVWAQTIARYPVEAIAINLSLLLGMGKFLYIIPTACAAGNYSLGYAYDLIRSNKLDLIIAGGSDPITRYAFAGFGRLFAMAPDKCQPFDKNRKGMMVGEGAAMLILESLESARLRNANIYAEIVGYALSCDAKNMTIPSSEGIEKVIKKAIHNSNIKREEIDYINAHGTGTVSNDKTECEAIKTIFGDLTKKICISSIKSMLGHTMGAASAIEAATCCLAVQNDIIPPTINYETPDPECDIDCVPNKAKKKKVRVALNNSFAFGGNNACVVFKKYTN